MSVNISEELSNGAHSKDAVPIAIIGMGWRGPGDATDVQSFYEMLAAAREARTAAHQGKWNHEAFYHPESSRKGTSNVEAGHYFKDDLSLFDAPFFSMTDTEAACLDPQQRLLLETCYEALENAGIPVAQAAGSETSVFVSTFGADYTDLLQRDPDSMPLYQATSSGYSRAIISNRLSHFFDFRGSSMTIDTACSGGLAALHLACQSIRTGEARQSVCGGSSVILHPDQFISLSAMRFLSPEGRCYSFDERACGYARGEGVGCVILKRLDHALADRDPVRAIVRMTGSNQDGRTPGISFPSRDAQVALIKSVYQRAGLDPLETSYVEAHGTGTQAGDPIEMSAISEVMCSGRSHAEPVTVGSVKANIGHLEAASGIAAIVKSVLMLENKVIFPNRNFEKPNPRIPLGQWNIKVPLELESWTCGGSHRLSINSFGYGGTNAHAILESADEFLKKTSLQLSKAVLSTSSSQLPRPRLLLGENGCGKDGHGSLNGASQMNCSSHNGHVSHSRRVYSISAFDEPSIKRLAKNLASHLRTAVDRMDNGYMGDLAHTLNSKRSSFTYTAAVVARGADDLAEALERDSLLVARARVKAPVIGFVFTGQGAQWAGMGRELMDAFPVYARTIQRCRDHLLSIGAAWDLIDELAKDSKTSCISMAKFSQPLCSAIQIGLIELLASWRIRPHAVTGHSSGEIAAAYAAGFISLEDAMSSAYHRGIFSERVAAEGPIKGAMMAVGLGPGPIQHHLDALKQGYATVACENSPHSVTISGDLAAIEELGQRLEAEGIFARKLRVEAAYHSRHMAIVEDDYIDSISGMETREGYGVNFFSSVTGKRCAGDILGPSYWAANMLGKVRFASSLNQLCRDGANILLEIGPHSALAGPIKQIIQADRQLEKSNIKYASVLLRKHDAVQTAMATAATLVMEGVPVDLSSVNVARGDEKIVIDLPPYPWNKSKSYWAESRLSKEYRNRPYARLDLLGKPEPNFNPFDARWRNVIRGTEIPWIKDHRIQSNVVYPAAGYISMAIEAVRQIALGRSWTPKAYRFREISIGQALVISGDSDEVETSITLRPQSEGTRASSDTWFEFFIYSVAEDNRWTEHCRGMVSIDRVEDEETSLDRLGRAAAIQHTCTSNIPIKEFYETLAGVGLRYGPSFSNMTAARCKPFDESSTTGACVACITLPDTASLMPAGYQHTHVLHPAVLDSVFHSLFAALGAGSGQLREPLVPTFIESLDVAGDVPQQPGHQWAVHTSTHSRGARRVRASITVADGENPSHTIIRLDGLTCTKLASGIDTLIHQGNASTAYSIMWEAELDLLGSEAERTTEEQGCTVTAVHPKHLEQRCLWALEKLVEDVSASPVPQDQHHLKAFLEWARDSQPRLRLPAERNQPLPQSNSPETELLDSVTANLADVVCGKKEIGAILKANDLLRNAFISWPSTKRQLEKISTHLNLLGRLNPYLEVLELGAGAGWSTAQLIDGIGRIEAHTPRFTRYDIVLGDPSHADKLAENISGLNGLVNVRDISLQQALENPSFHHAGYDVIVGVLLSVDVESLARAQQAISILLKPGGTLILLEPRQDDIVNTTLFGTLSSWSLQPPCQWEKGLEDVASCDAQDTGTQGAAGERMMTVITPHHGRVSDNRPEVLVIADPDTDEAGSMICPLVTALASHGVNVEVSSLHKANPSGKVCIVLWELLGANLARLCEGKFQLLRTIFTRSSGVLSVIRDPSSDPTAGMVTGFVRTVRSEMSDTAGLLLDIGSVASCTEIASAVPPLLARHFWTQDASVGALDTEYKFRDRRLMVPRLVPAEDINRDVAITMGRASAECSHFLQAGRHLRAVIGSPGLFDTIQFVDDEEAIMGLATDHVEIEVRAIGLNFRDVMMAMGQIDVEALGGECSGVVTAVGASVSNVAIGDHVCCIHLGTFRSRVHSDARLVQKLPEGWSFETGAAIPVVYCTAFYSVFQAANLKPGETVLIHAASGGLGQALIQLCQQVGAEIFVTVGSTDKRALISERFRIPQNHILSSRDSTFSSMIMRLTEGRGVDVIMNSLAGEDLRLSWTCMAPFGRFIELGKRDFFMNTRLEMAGFSKNVSFAAVDLVDLIKLKPGVVASILAESMALLRQDIVKAPWPITSYPMAQLKTALQTMQSGRHKGKLVLVPQTTDMVQVLPSPVKGTVFRADATYVLAGGMGGLGRSIARWMVHNGARNLIICSRSGDSSPGAKEMVQALRADGTSVLAYACDIADEMQLRSVIHDALTKLPPVRGVIQSAMVLRDSMLERMTVNDFNTVIRPKVQGTMNLHALFPKDLDFFIMLSSISGVIGNASQAAYAAGNTFMDGFAAFRHSLGQPAVTIDLGVMLGIGHLAENQELAEAMRRQGFSGTTEVELMAFLASATRRPYHGQIVTGLGAWRADSSLGNFAAPLFANFRRAGWHGPDGQGGEGDQASGLRAALAAAKDAAEATSLVIEALAAQTSTLGMVPRDSISSSRPLSEYGIDSLVAVEMRNWIFREMDYTVAILELMANQSIEKLATKIAMSTHLVNSSIRKA